MLQKAQERPVDLRLGHLLDKLVAVGLDLKPLCQDGAKSQSIGPTAATISGACDVLQSAIVDLRAIIRQIDGLPAR